MINASDINPSETLSIFSSLGLSATFLVPTETAMKKSIIDATHPVRRYFVEHEFHNYLEQPQGQKAKVLKPTFFVHPDGFSETKTSLYRPPTKDGDPRIWFYDLNSYGAAYNLLAVLVHDDTIYLINCSDPDILTSLESGSNPIFAALSISADGLTPEATELLGMLKEVGQLGWVKNLRTGDTGVGYTLETILGIPANSSKSPDYKGVEIKAGRKRSSNQSLFGKTPNWDKSRLKGSLHILDARGRYSEEKARRQLFHSIYASKPNSYGMQLDVNFEHGLLTQYCIESGQREDDVFWELEVLQSALKKKHGQTFWVKTKTRGGREAEEFFYSEGFYTRGPNIDAFPLLLEAGEVFVDYTIKEIAPGRVKDQGYLFRMKQNRLELLFGKPKVFDLTKGR